MDLLTKKEFEAGFGSHTPIFCGQTKCVRYYMNFERAMAVVKQCLDRDGRAFYQHNNPGRSYRAVHFLWVPRGQDQQLNFADRLQLCNPVALAAHDTALRYVFKCDLLPAAPYLATTSCLLRGPSLSTLCPSQESWLTFNFAV